MVPFDLAYRKKFIITTYYGATIPTIRKGLCSYCEVKDGVINQELKKCYNTVQPICKECKKFKDPMKRMPHKTAEAQRTINKMFPKEIKH